MTTPGSKRSTLRGLTHLPALDGLRGLAVASVIGLHMHYAPGGNNGVTLFFTLSGFLITALLLEEHDARGSVSLRDFYIRRALRLLPALFLVLAAHLLYAVIFHSGYRLKEDVAAAMAALFYSSNWCLAFRWLPLRDLAHTWSLAIEEQFYLIWPFVIVLLARIFGDRRVLTLAILVAAAALALERFVLAAAGATEARLYNGLDTRADGLLFGAAAAVVYRYNLLGRLASSKRFLMTAGWLILAAILAHLFGGIGAVPRSTEFVSLAGYTVIALLTSLLVVTLTCGTASDTPLHKLLGFGPLQYIGKISYGLYLWHFLVLVFMDEQFPTLTAWVAEPIKLLLVAVLCVTSYHFVERPCLRMKDKLAPRQSGTPRTPQRKTLAPSEAAV